MSLDYATFFNAINPSKTLVYSSPTDRQYYIDFSSVRGGEIIKKIKNRIVELYKDRPSCSLFTGHIGCGKSTELHKLKSELEAENFFVVYFESDKDLDTGDVDIVEVLLTIAKQISEALEKHKTLNQPQAPLLRRLLQRTTDILMTEMEVKGGIKSPISVGGMSGSLEVDTEKQALSLSAGIASLTVKAKDDSGIREKLNQYLGPQTTELVRTINEDLIKPGIETLKQNGYAGLAVIVDNLDRVDHRQKASGKTQQEYLFVDRGEILTQFACHTIYTMPLALQFSNEYGNLRQRFPDPPECLPMVAIKTRTGEESSEGIEKLKQMVLARAFPQLSEAERLERVEEIFETMEVFNRLCRVSGGHVRDLLQLLSQWVQEEMQLPLTEDSLDDAIADNLNKMSLGVSPEEWELLRQVHQTKKVQDTVGYERLIRTRRVFEYVERRKSWFDVNPIFLESDELFES